MKLTKTILRNPPEGHIQTRRATLLPARRFRVWRRGSRAKGQDTRARAPRDDLPLRKPLVPLGRAVGRLG